MKEWWLGVLSCALADWLRVVNRCATMQWLWCRVLLCCRYSHALCAVCYHADAAVVLPAPCTVKANLQRKTTQAPRRQTTQTTLR